MFTRNITTASLLNHIMEVTSLFTFLLLGLLNVFAYAQQFEDIVMGLDYPGVSENCAEALNTTMPGCPSFLIRVSVDNPRLNSDQLTNLCTSRCRSSMTSVRQVIASTCNKNTDVVNIDDVIWPGLTPSLVYPFFLQPKQKLWLTCLV